jgi:hypothetical protein
MSDTIYRALSAEGWHASLSANHKESHVIS